MDRLPIQHLEDWQSAEPRNPGPDKAFGPFLLLALKEAMLAATVLALSAAGLSLVFGVMHVVNVANGEFYMLGALLAFAVTTLGPGPPAFGFLAALIFAPLVLGALAAAADALILKRLD